MLMNRALDGIAQIFKGAKTVFIHLWYRHTFSLMEKLISLRGLRPFTIISGK